MALVLVTGAKGQVGSEIVPLLLENNHKVLALSHQDLDIADENAVASLFESTSIEVVINCAAYTAVDKAEDEKDLAYAVNALGPKNLAKECKEHNIPLIHISTDYVYDNLQAGPHSEEEHLNSNCVYGNTKLHGEKFVEQSGCKAVILRASWIFGRYGKNFVKAMYNLAKTHDSLKVVCDEIGNPTPARALAIDIVKITNALINGSFTAFGTYNYCGQKAIARDDFARVILNLAFKLKLLDREIVVNKISSKEFGAKAVRPSDSRMSTDKLERVLGLVAPNWVDYIEETLKG